MLKNDEMEIRKKEIGKRIKDLYNKKHMTQTQLAAAIGMSQSDLSGRLNNGKITLDNCIEIADALDVSLSELFDISSSQRDSEHLSPRDICKMIVSLCESKYGFEITEAKEDLCANMVLLGATIEEGLPSYPGSSYTKLARRAIVGFLARFKKISDMKREDAGNANGFDNEMYNDLLEKYLEGVPDLMQSLAGQVEFNKQQEERKK